MHKLTQKDKVEMAVDRLINTTKTIEQIRHESSLSWMKVSEIARELMKLESGILEHRKVYAPVELKTHLGPSVKLNADAWHREVERQEYKRPVWFDGEHKAGPKARTSTTANLLSKYKQRASA